jgi:hypothetical protein
MKETFSQEVIEDDLRPEYDFRALRVAARGPGKKMQISDSPTISQDEPDDLLPEYRFDYRKARPNRFAVPAQQKQP